MKRATAADAGSIMDRLLRIVPAALVEEATRWMAGRLRLMEKVAEVSKEARKLGLMMLRAVNADHILTEEEEAIVRGVDPKTLPEMKQRRELPPFIQGVIVFDGKV